MKEVPLIWVLAGIIAGLLAAALPPPPVVPKVVVFEANSAMLSARTGTRITP